MKWYDKGKILSFRAFLNFLIGNRGSGKTYEEAEIKRKRIQEIEELIK